MPRSKGGCGAKNTDTLSFMEKIFLNKGGGRPLKINDYNAIL